jgi:hypothetical protein
MRLAASGEGRLGLRRCGQESFGLKHQQGVAGLDAHNLFVEP